MVYIKNKLILLLAVFVIAVMVASIVSAATTTIRPDGAGHRKGWAHVGCSGGTSEYQCVDEATLDTNDYLRTSGTRKETFTFDDTGLTTETINSVTMHYVAMEHNSANNRCYQAMVRSGGTDYMSGVQMCVNATWQETTHTYTTNPATSSAWTVSDVDALEAGMRGLNPDGGGRVAQVWAVVDYDPLDSCSDTDGSSITTQGTVSGFSGGSPYNLVDFCIDATTVLEYTCAGTAASNFNTTCSGNFTSCVSGACV